MVEKDQRRLTKNEKRRQRQKQQQQDGGSGEGGEASGREEGADLDTSGVQIEYVAADLSSDPTAASILDQFQAVFQKFARPEELLAERAAAAAAEEAAGEASGADQEGDEGEADVEGDAAGAAKRLSKKKKKLLSRLSVAELKQLVHRPDVVEAHDVTSSDPRLLVFLKAYRNTVPVPRHWCHKRKYLQGKRGVEKPPFQLPEFIADTGIAKIRESVLEQEALKKSKQKARDRLQPKMGKIDIDYQVLHDAFFKYQKKPKMTGHGDLYYEGKENEVDLKTKKPGVLSEELKTALGMQPLAPPPWLINMQRYGPPPSYPSLVIPGLTAPIPEGASFGYHTGGWGKPPVDEYGRPLYGDVFGNAGGDDMLEIAVDRTRWGQIVAPEYPEYSEEEEEEEEEGGPAVVSEAELHGAEELGTETPMTADGISSMISGLETPDAIDLRKRTGFETPDVVAKELYHVIQERSASAGAGGQFFGSDRTYVLPGAESVGTAVASEGAVSVAKSDAGEDGAAGKRKRKADANAASKRQKEFEF